MPANLTPQYHKVELEYRRAQTPQEQMDCLERMLQLIPRHKGTEKLQADLKSRLKEARRELQVEKQSPKRAAGFRFPRQGAGQIVLLGGPNAGKSRVLAELTNAQPQVAEFPFTTREPMPGMMPWEDASVQLIDTPPVTEHHLEPYLLNMVRSADGVLLCLDGSSDDAPDETLAVMRQFERRKVRFGNHTGFDDDDFSVVIVQTQLVVTRGQAAGADERLEYFREAAGRNLTVLRVDLDRQSCREKLRDAVYSSLNVIRVYTKRPGKPAEYVDPYTIPRNGTVEDLAVLIHREFAETLRFARVWGSNVREGQTVGREHRLSDGDMVELHA